MLYNAPAMTTITIAREQSTATAATYRAFGRERTSTGATPGQALDALSAQLEPQAVGSMVVIMEPGPDEFFPAELVERLQQLMVLHRAALDVGSPMSAAAETEASGRRAEAVARRLRA